MVEGFRESFLLTPASWSGGHLKSLFLSNILVSRKLNNSLSSCFTESDGVKFGFNLARFGFNLAEFGTSVNLLNGQSDGS